MCFSFVFYGLTSCIFSSVFYGSIEAITEAVHRWFHFSKYRQCLITAPVVPTACLHIQYATTVYAFGAPTTRLRVWCTYKALTNQRDALVYRLHSLLQYKGQSPPSK